MSAEKINKEQNPTTLITPGVNEVKFTRTVDINSLLARARIQKKEENKVNLIFFFLFAALILISGILLSL